MLKSKPELADAIENIARDLFAGSFPGTERVKAAFHKHGEQFGFVVSARGIVPKPKYGEWLYDLAWFAEDEDGFLVHVPFVLECEKKPDRHLDGDFQKLVQAKADVRLWVAVTNPKQSVSSHVSVCRTQIAKFQGTVIGDTYILVVYGTDGLQAVIERIISN